MFSRWYISRNWWFVLDSCKTMNYRWNFLFVWNFTCFHLWSPLISVLILFLVWESYTDTKGSKKWITLLDCSEPNSFVRAWASSVERCRGPCVVHRSWCCVSNLRAACNDPVIRFQICRCWGMLLYSFHANLV